MNEEILIPLTFFFATAIILLKFIHGRHVERIKMIERGVSPGDLSLKDIDKVQSILRALKWGLLLMCGGIGFLVGYVIMLQMGRDDDPSVVFGSTVVAGGIGLLIFYAIANKKNQAGSL